MTPAGRLDARLAPVLAQRRADGLWRACRALTPAPAGTVRLGGREVVSFCSNDYLGLAGEPRLAAAAAEELARSGTGSGSAHLIAGHREVHERLEQALAAWVGYERALLFSTGYMANLGVINALAEPGAAIFQDRLNHASLLDGGWLSRGRMHRYPHADTAALAAALAEAPSEPPALLVTDGLFSMDGDLAPLPALAQLAEAQGATLLVDDAHGLGVLGPGGRGSVAAAGLDAAQVPVYVGTLGKALGSFGAFVAGSATLIDFLVQRARTFIYTTAPPPAMAAATLAAVAICRAEPGRRRHLHRLVARFRAGAAARGLPVMPSSTPIQPLRVGEAALALELSARLLEAGFLVTAIRPPTVPPGTARLRITLSAAHTDSQVADLLVQLDRLVPMSLRSAQTDACAG